MTEQVQSPRVSTDREQIIWLAEKVMGWTEPRISDATIAEVERILEQEAIDYPLSLKLEFQRIFNAIARTALPDAIREIKRLRELAEAALAALRQEPTDAA